MRRLALSFAAVAITAAFPSTASAAFTLGVAAGEVRSSSAVLWAHATSGSRASLQVATDRRFRNVVDTARVTPRRSDDYTVQARTTGLRAGRTYYYRFLQGRTRSALGRFETAPRSTANATVAFAFSGDADATPTASGRPNWSFAVYRRMMLERNDFNFNFGDTIYSDSSINNTPPALTTSQKWRKYRQNLGQRDLANLRGSTGIYSHWDDHEFINDFSRAENGNAIYTAGVNAFRDYAPVTYTSRDGLYRSFRWGRNVEVFMLDQRSFRDAKASQGGTCNNPQTGAPDLAPTAPQDKRNLFSALVPSLSQPVSPACLARINDPSRTLLGQRQYGRFTAAVQRSTATWKIIMNETPIQQFYALPYDRWEGYEAERDRMLESLRNVRNLVFLTTDTHANFMNDVRFQTLEPGGPIDSGHDEVVSGPVATNPFSKEIDEVSGRPGAGELITAAFFKPAPPDGVGMKCANGNVYSYAQVKATNTALTITAKDINGRVVNDAVANPPVPCVLSLQRQ